jgi:hypothetical protein
MELAVSEPFKLVPSRSRKTGVPACIASFHVPLTDSMRKHNRQKDVIGSIRTRLLGMEIERRLRQNALGTIKQHRDTRHPLPAFRLSYCVGARARNTPLLLDRVQFSQPILRIRRRMRANAAVTSAHDIPCKRRLCLRRTTTLSTPKSPRPLSVRKTST